jgi:hypothetical protein
VRKKVPQITARKLNNRTRRIEIFIFPPRNKTELYYDQEDL